MKKIILVLSLVVVSYGMLFAEEQITITTYYPSPYGSYNSLQTDKLGVGDNNGDGSLTSADVPTTGGDVWIKGNVGIGTQSPSKPLEVKGDFKIWRDVTGKNPETATYARIDLGSDEGMRFYRTGEFLRLRTFDKKYNIFAIETDPDVPLMDPNYGKEAAISLNRGIEGVGRELFTLTNLDYGVGSHTMRITLAKTGTGTFTPFVIRYWNIDNGTSIDTFSIKPRLLGAEINAADVIFPSSGNVGIGTTAPGYTLDVNGTANAVAYRVGGAAGLNQTINVRKSDGSGPCSITVTNGIITATTC